MSRCTLVHYCEPNNTIAQCYKSIHDIREATNLDIDSPTRASDFNVLCGSIFGEGTNEKTSKKVLALIEQKRPKWGLFEIAGNHSLSRYMSDGTKFLTALDELGYNTYQQIVHPKAWGIPYDKASIYLVYIIRDLDTGQFKFPVEVHEDIHLLDLLESHPKLSTYMRIDKSVTPNSLIYEFTSDRDETHVAEYNHSVPTLPLFNSGRKCCVNTAKLHGKDTGISLRYLTPLEYYRLVGFDDTDYYRVLNTGISVRHLCDLAANSPVIPVIYHICHELHRVMPYLFTNIHLLDCYSGLGAYTRAIKKLCASFSHAKGIQA